MMAMKFHKHLFCAFVCALLLASLGGRAVGAEVVALKNNLAYDAALTPNLELEFVLAPRWTMEIGAGFNPFPLKDTQFPKWRHVSAWVAPRYWFCHAFHRDFISVNAAYAMYNVAGNAWPVAWMYPQVKDSRYEGHAAMAGVSYGWHFAISPHFSVELEGGVDAGYSWFTQYECKHCGACLKPGCPALTKQEDGTIRIDPTMCNGCGLCMSQCHFGAIEKVEAK